MTGANTNIGGGPAALTLNPFHVRGDLLGKAQNEPSCALSTRNPQHVLCGANDYRMVDVPGVSITSEVRDAWLGVFQSVDGGDTWESTIHPGFFLDPAPHPLRADNFRAAADPTVRTGPAGLAIYSGIAFGGPDRDDGVVFASTFIDLNNREFDRMPFKFVRTAYIDRGTAGQFIDKPWILVEANGGTCSLQVPVGDGTTVAQTIPGSTVHILYSVFVGNMDVVVRTKAMYARSTDCGATFSRPIKVSESLAVNNGSGLAKTLAVGSSRLFGTWRRFATPNAQIANAIVAIASNDNGATWTKANVVAEMCPFDQVTTKTQFRATAFPAITADASGRAYVVWADRGRDPVTNACNAFGKARLMLSTSMDGINWSAPQHAAPSASDEHQIFPSIAFTAGKLVLAWVDFKEDASGVFARFVNESDVLLNQPAIRHTGDVRVAMADPGAAPDFGPDVTRVSRYLKGVGTVNGQKVIGQIQWNAFNRRWAKKGAVPFDGDYIDIATAPYLPPDPLRGRPDWTPNNGQVPLTPTVLIAWADNRDMRRLPVPENPEVAVPYVTPFGLDLPSASFFDPLQSRPVCTPGVNNYATGTMNQNVYAARATRAFAASSPGNNKTLGTIQRAFVVVVRNDTNALKQYREVVSPPAGGFASFDQFDTTRTSIVVTVPRHSSVARTVFVTPNRLSPTPLDPDAVVPVTVTELVGGTPGQATTIFLNSDKSAPEIDGPEIDGPEIDGAEVYTPEIDGPEIDGHGTPAPEIDGPEIDGPEIDGGEILSLGVQTPEIDGPEIDGPEIDGPEIDGPEIDGSALDTSAVTDVTYKITNKGNTTAQVNAKALVEGPAHANYQVIVRRRFPVPTVDENCMPTSVNISKVAVSILNSDVGSPEIDGPEIDSAALGTASFHVATGETVDLVVRVRTETEPTPAELNAIARSVEVAVQQEAVNTEDLRQGITEPPVFTSFLSIADSQLPSGVVGTSYSRQLQASGGEGALAWTLLEGGELPTGLGFNAGLISGTPAAAGSFTFTVEVQDSGTPAQVATKTFTIVIAQAGTASLAFVTQPSDTEFGRAISPAPSVKAFSASGMPAAGVPVAIALGSNPGGTTLGGTLTATTGPTGVATFPSLTIGNPASGYRLAATATGFAAATSIPFDVGAAPDLVVQSLTHLPIPPTTGGMITFTAVVRNAGAGPAAASTLLFQIQGETAGDPGTLFGVPALAAGASHTVQRRMALAPGAHTNTARADFTNAVSEASEANNTSTDTYTVVTSDSLTLTVTNTNDSGPGSLRQALIASNEHPGITDTIVFAIPGGGPHRIAPLSPLPGINDPVLIDAPATGDCSGASPTIEIDGSLAGLSHGLFVASGGTTIRGLAITNFGSPEFAGIFLAGGAASVIECSYLGLAPDGTTVKGNYDGIRVGGSFNNTIGGTTAAVRNVISGNLRNGVLIRGPVGQQGSIMQTVVQGNFIGTDASGTQDRGNAANGVHIIDSASNTIGGATAGARNVVSGNGGEGVRIDGAFAAGNDVRANYIGTTASGAADLGNGASGVYIRRAPGNSVVVNVVSGNDGFAGIAVCGNAFEGGFCGGGDFGDQGTDASGNIIRGNRIGTDAAGIARLGNSGRGVSIDGASNTIVGGPLAGEGNVISASGANGVVIFGTRPDGTLIRGNAIGTDISLGTNLGNTGAGVLIQSGANTLVSGREDDRTAPNTIRFNTGAGILVTGGTGHRLRINRFENNGGLGIDLGAAGVTPDDPGDADAGPNGLQNAPALSSVSTSGSTITIVGSLHSAPNTTFTIDLYASHGCDPGGWGEGNQWFGAFVGTTNADGNLNFNVGFSSVGVLEGQLVTALATSGDFVDTMTGEGSTSEFSGCRMVLPPGLTQWAVSEGGNGHVYQYVTTPGTWTAARGAAEARTFRGISGHLATIASAGENAFVSQFRSNNDLRAWIGLTDAASEGTFVWITEEPVVYTNWNTGEPNNGAGIEDYVEIFAAGVWNDQADNSGGLNQGYLVEYDVNQVLAPPGS